MAPSSAAAHLSSGLPTRAFVAVLFFLALISLSCAARLPLSKQKLEVQKHLKRLNKPAVKTIKVPLHLSLHLAFPVYRLGSMKTWEMDDTGRSIFFSLFFVGSFHVDLS